VADLSREGLHEKHAVATWNLGTLKSEENQEVHGAESLPKFD
jgi:hypothetical protein